MKIHIKWLAFFSLLSVWACTEEITIDPPEGKKIPVVDGSITDEFKRHEVVLSYANELYSHEKEMISNARVYLAGGGDTIFFYEQEDKPGHYLTDSVAGKRNTRYLFDVVVSENAIYSWPLHISTEVKMPRNAERLDSIRLLPKMDNQDVPFIEDSMAVCICPYFQTLSDPEIVYNVVIYLNNSRFSNRPSKLFQLFPMKGYAGYYFNGPEMLEDNIELPLGVMNKVYLHDGDTVKMKLYSISKDYMYYLLNQKLAIGVNPVMGAFPAMFTNLQSNCGAVGWFSATSVIEAEDIYHDFW